MLYLITLGVIIIWMMMLLSKRQLSLHSVITAYVIGVSCADFFEGLFNLILGFYSFPTHLSENPIYENEFGVIFADFLIVLMSGAYTEENEEENTIGDDFDFGLERILDGIESYLLSKKR